ncbi:hypothetical protein M3Y94_00561400 [Aphelenchoides besseyi]|nr:hypothetical protein M3Y94_00561400 [Aphelenchoides besseyi]
MNLSTLILLFGVVISVVVAQQENQKPEDDTVAEEQPKSQDTNPIRCNRCRRRGYRGLGVGGITVNGQSPHGNIGRVLGGRRRGAGFGWRRGRGWRRNRRRLALNNDNQIKASTEDYNSNQNSGDIGSVPKTNVTQEVSSKPLEQVELHESHAKRETSRGGFSKGARSKKWFR